MDTISFVLLIKELFTLRAIVDILLIAGGMFILYQTLLRSGTWKIVTGILLGMVFFLIARVFDLRGIEWIYSNVSSVAVIALIVIFQPELRKFLERTVSMRRVENTDAANELTDLIIKSLQSLSDQRRGAIIVLPGKESIEEWMAGGYPLDATPSYPLIMSIFDPNSPGHDGALIVEKGRFSRLGVRLPISQTSKLSDSLGTRHHAGMGLAENSDALVFVVSEESGLVSLFSDGVHSPIEQDDQIRAAIADHRQEMATLPVDLPAGKMRWPAALKAAVSIILAIVFWCALTVSQGEIVEKVLTVPLVYKGMPSHLIMTGEKQEEVRLVLAGNRSALENEDDLISSIEIDLSKAAEGKQTFLINEDNIALPKDLQLIEIMPSSLSLNLVALVEKEVVVKPQLVGQPRENVKIKLVTVIPEKVKALVPTTVSKKSAISVTTTPVNLEGVTGDALIHCRIIAEPSFQPLDKRWPEVKVQITVEPVE